MAHKLKMKIEEMLQHILLDISPSSLLRKHVSLKNNKFFVDGKLFDLSKSNLFVIGCGKAGVSMSEAIEDILGPEHIKAGFVIAPENIVSHTRKIKIFRSTHPFISQTSFLAGKKMIQFLRKVERDDIVICLLSGGGSALLAYPARGLDFNEKLDFINYLILQGVPEIEVNIVRKVLSGVKGGKIARRLRCNDLINLLLLDNNGDIGAIASGPTLIPKDKKTAKAVLKEHGLYNGIPDKLKEIVDSGSREDISFKYPRIKNVLIGDNILAKESLAKYSLLFGCKKVWTIPQFFYKDIEAVTDVLAKEFKRRYDPVSEKGIYAVIAGGEVPVKSKGIGRGGRNQHLAAIMINKLKGFGSFAFASFATDGCDYIEGVRGSIITNKTVSRVKREKIDVERYIRNYNTFYLHKRLNSLLMGGMTGTNVSDVYIFLFEKK